MNCEICQATLNEDGSCPNAVNHTNLTPASTPVVEPAGGLAPESIAEVPAPKKTRTKKA